MRICDRCRKEIKNEDFTGINCYERGEEKSDYEFCEECMADIMSIIDIECEAEPKVYDVEYKEIK